MRVPELGTLNEVSVRDAWDHEAHSFTPWLAQHLSTLGDVIGVPLELEGQEVAVERFAADILARNPQDDSLVLIENQLEAADHVHLGQVLTYLAGLEAHTVVWVATHFRDAHLSALKWLNEHTVEPFAFFAVRLKAVRIGDSPIAPIFEVVIKPNEWERSLHATAEQAHAASSRTAARREFWTLYLHRYPGEQADGPAHGSSNRWRRLTDLDLVISLYFAGDGVGIFVRGLRGAHGPDVYERLAPHADRLDELMQTDIGSADKSHFYHLFKPANTSDRDGWPELTDWLHQTANAYEEALREVLEAAYERPEHPDDRQLEAAS